MTRNRIATNLDEVFEAIRRARKFVNGKSEQSFLEDELRQQAVTMSIMIIGEAVIRLQRDEPEFVSRHRELPWTNMRNMRNRIAHGYFNVDMGAVWDTVQNDMPDLRARLLTICAEEGLSVLDPGP